MNPEQNIVLIRILIEIKATFEYPSWIRTSIVFHLLWAIQPPSPLRVNFYFPCLSLYVCLSACLSLSLSVFLSFSVCLSLSLFDLWSWVRGEQSIRFGKRQIKRRGGVEQIVRDVGDWTVDRALHPIESAGMLWNSAKWTGGQVVEGVKFAKDVVVSNGDAAKEKAVREGLL